jgi:hypothetical protein
MFFLKCILICVNCMLCFFMFLFVFSYFILKLLKSKIDINSILFYDYTKKTKRILNVYGDNIITKIYLIKQPLSELITFALNICSFYNNEINDFFPYHTQLIFEIKNKNKTKKLILLEKNRCINIDDNFHISNKKEMKHIRIKKTHTINSILKTTQDRIGVNRFFNWSLCNNNCQTFTKECLVTVNKYNKDSHDYIFSDKLIKPTEFVVNSLNCICNIYNMCLKPIDVF